MLVIEKEMEKAKDITENAINEHWLAFLSQMRDKIGVENITLKQEYLKYSIAKNALHYLKRLENLQLSLSDTGGSGESGGSIITRLNSERNRHVISVKQDMDANRQQEFGMKKYIWRTAGDDRVRPAHAANEGKVFAWDEGEKPGESYNCRCSAEPFPEYHGVDDPPTQPVYPLENLIALWFGLGVAKKIGKDILEWFTDDKPTDKPASQPKPEVQKPDFERPKGVPENWEQSPSNKGEGTRYRDPNNPHNEVRLQKGKPEVSNPSQQKDYVRWKKDGGWLDKDSKPSTDIEETHIPIEEFKFKL